MDATVTEWLRKEFARDGGRVICALVRPSPTQSRTRSLGISVCVCVCFQRVIKKEGRVTNRVELLTKESAVTKKEGLRVASTVLVYTHMWFAVS